MRKKYIIEFIIILLIECLIAIFFKKGFIRENIGDILVVPCIYTLLRIFFMKIKHLSLYVLLFAITVEFLQLFNITNFLALNNKILKIALGSTFDIKDIICYIIGYILIIILEKLTTIKNNSKKVL